MKKIIFFFFIVCILAVSVDANDNRNLSVSGYIKSIDKQSKSFIVTDSFGESFNIAIVPFSNIEYIGKIVYDAKFGNLDVGNFVMVDYYSGRQIHTARTVNIYKTKE